MAEPSRHIVRKFGVNVIRHTEETSNSKSDTEKETTPEPSPLEEAAYWNREYNDTEQQFGKYQATLPKNLKGEAWHKYRENVAKYEDDLRYNYNHTDNAIKQAMNRQEIVSQYEIAKAEPIYPSLEGENSIEAASGIFYRERLRELNQAIADNPDSASQEKSINTIENTWTKVKAYIDAARNYELRNQDTAQYQRARRSAHNSMIKQLNSLNHLAEQNNTTPFTIRNFLTNDFHYDSHRDHNHALEHRVNYDRESVLEYFRNAYIDQFAEAEQKTDQGHIYSSRNSEQDL